MRGLVIFLIVLVGILFLSLVVANINLNKPNKEEIKINEKTKILEFSTFTSAVCENKADVVHCKDEVFVNCNGTISKAADIAECNGIKFDVPKATGFATFGRDWKDPRGRN